MSHVKYPTSLPVDCVRRATEILRKGEIAERSAEFGEDYWNVQGYVQNLLLGPAPDHANQFGSAAADQRQKAFDKELKKAKENEDLRELASAVQDAIGEQQKGEFGAGAAAAATAPLSERPFLQMLITQLPALLQLLIQLGVFTTAGTPKSV